MSGTSSGDAREPGQGGVVLEEIHDHDASEKHYVGKVLAYPPGSPWRQPAEAADCHSLLASWLEGASQL